LQTGPNYKKAQQWRRVVFVIDADRKDAFLNSRLNAFSDSLLSCTADGKVSWAYGSA